MFYHKNGISHRKILNITGYWKTAAVDTYKNFGKTRSVKNLLRSDHSYTRVIKSLDLQHPLSIAYNILCISRKIMHARVLFDYQSG